MLLNISFIMYFSLDLLIVFISSLFLRCVFNRFSCMLNKLRMVVLCSVKSDSYSNADFTSELGLFSGYFMYPMLRARMSDCRDVLPTSPLASTLVVGLFTPSILFMNWV